MHGREICRLSGWWDFLFEEGKGIPDFFPEDTVFKEVQFVPGAFDAASPYRCRRGCALYRTEFTLNRDFPAGEVRIALGLRGRIWIDGRCIGETALPYTGERFNFGALAAGRHVMAVAVDNRFLTGGGELFRSFYDFYAYGGIFRTVDILLYENVSGLDRIQVRTLDYCSGTVELTVFLRGGDDYPVELEWRFDTETDFHKTAVCDGEKITAKVADFKLWSPASPCLHRIEARVAGDSMCETFGVRQVGIGNGNLLLNGEAVYLKGVNRHESAPLFGAAVSEAVMREDLVHARELGCNFIRGCHYPQNPAFLDLCDRMGFLVWEESLGWGDGAERLADELFVARQLEQTRKMVRNSINHPSVIIWGFLNEFDSATGAGKAAAEKLAAAIREEDGGRPVTFACNHIYDDVCCSLADIISCNIYPGWIETPGGGDPLDEIAPELDRLIRHMRSIHGAAKPLLISETGCCAVYGERDAAAAQWTEDFQAGYVDMALTQILQRSEICGVVIWQLNDSASYHRSGAPLRVKPLGQNLAGLFDAWRRPKLVAGAVKKHFDKR